MPELIRWLHARSSSHETNVLRFDECVYTTYSYEHVDEARGLKVTPAWVFQRGRPPYRPDSSGPRTGDLLGMPELHADVPSDHGLHTISEEGEEDGPRRAADALASQRVPAGAVRYVPEVFLMEYGST